LGGESRRGCQRTKSRGGEGREKRLEGKKSEWGETGRGKTVQ